MRRKMFASVSLVVLMLTYINTSYGAFGTETYTAIVVKVECSMSGGGELSGEISPGGGGGSISGCLLYTSDAADE